MRIQQLIGLSGFRIYEKVAYEARIRSQCSIDQTYGAFQWVTVRHQLLGIADPLELRDYLCEWEGPLP